MNDKLKTAKIVMINLFKAFGHFLKEVFRKPDKNFRKRLRSENRHHPLGYDLNPEHFVQGIFHCEKCDIAGHYYTLGITPCYDCGEHMVEREARWEPISQRWVFYKR